MGIINLLNSEMDYDEIPDWYGEENAGNLRY